MTKKIFTLAIVSLFILVGSVMAEQSATGMGGKKYYEQQVFVDAYNNTGGTLLQNSVVVLDTLAGTAVDSLGAYVTTTTTNADVRVIGVVDSNQPLTNSSGTLTTQVGIPPSTVGRICVRGPHLVRYMGASIGSTLAQTDSNAGWAATLTASTASIPSDTAYGVLGIVLQSTSATVSPWVWINPHASR